MKQIKAEIIADSIALNGARLTTFIFTLPRPLLPEFNTHRAISRNSASSRAIPFKKMVEAVDTDPFVPLKFQKDHKGMQGTEYYEGEEHDKCVELWLEGKKAAVKTASDLNRFGATKQLCNRMLEPYAWHTIIATATDWENFIALRAHPQAEIHIAELAFKMLEAYNNSTPKRLRVGDWHIPFGDKFDADRLSLLADPSRENGLGSSFNELKVKIATARCARISYNDFEGNDNYLNDIRLHDQLAESGHWSPFEHCAKAGNRVTGYSGNFRGFTQYRKMFHGENKFDDRVISHTITSPGEML